MFDYEITHLTYKIEMEAYKLDTNDSPTYFHQIFVIVPKTNSYESTSGEKRDFDGILVVLPPHHQ